jgi:hypothetical protein
MTGTREATWPPLCRNGAPAGRGGSFEPPRRAAPLPPARAPGDCGYTGHMPAALRRRRRRDLSRFALIALCQCVKRNAHEINAPSFLRPHRKERAERQVGPPRSRFRRPLRRPKAYCAPRLVCATPKKASRAIYSEIATKSSLLRRPFLAAAAAVDAPCGLARRGLTLGPTGDTAPERYPASASAPGL